MNNRWLIFTLFCTVVSESIERGHRGAHIKINQPDLRINRKGLIVILPVKRRLGGDGCSAGSGGESRILNPHELRLIGVSTI